MIDMKKETEEVSDHLEPYSVCHDLFLRRAQALGNMTSKKRKKTEEANIVFEPEKSDESKNKYAARRLELSKCPARRTSRSGRDSL